MPRPSQSSKPARRAEEAGCHAGLVPALVPLALRSVKFRAICVTALLPLNLLLYGRPDHALRGFKLIDLIVHNLLGA